MAVGEDSFLLHQVIGCLPVLSLAVLPDRLDQMMHVTTLAALSMRTVFCCCLMDIVLCSPQMYRLEGLLVGLLVALNKVLHGIAGNNCMQLIAASTRNLEQVLSPQCIHRRHHMRLRCCRSEIYQGLHGIQRYRLAI